MSSHLCELNTTPVSVAGTLTGRFRAGSAAVAAGAVAGVAAAFGGGWLTDWPGQRSEFLVTAFSN